MLLTAIWLSRSEHLPLKCMLFSASVKRVLRVPCELAHIRVVKRRLVTFPVSKTLCAAPVQPTRQSRGALSASATKFPWADSFSFPNGDTRSSAVVIAGLGPLATGKRLETLTKVSAIITVTLLQPLARMRRLHLVSRSPVETWGSDICQTPFCRLLMAGVSAYCQSLKVSSPCCAAGRCTDKATMLQVKCTAGLCLARPSSFYACLQACMIWEIWELSVGRQMVSTSTCRCSVYTNHADLPVKA